MDSDVPLAEDGKGNISIRSRRAGQWAEITVSDDGCGIPEEVLPRIFDPFFTTKDVGRGTGQGLSIAYSTVVDGHDGTLEVDSERDVGTTFVIRLPLYEWDAQAAASSSGT